MNLADKDFFPTPEMRDAEGKPFVWPGPGVTVLEHATIQIAASMAANLGRAVHDEDLADMAYKLAKAVVARLEQGDDGDETSPASD